MWPRASRDSAVSPPAPLGASPGLLRRRYSTPEAVMRKYRLEQLSAQQSNQTVETCSCAMSETEARTTTPAEAVRRSALLRRLHGRAACACRCAPVSRSLDASRSELHPSSSASAAASTLASRRTSPKRLRMELTTPSSLLAVPSFTELILSDSLKLGDAAMSSFTDTDVLVSSTSDSSNKDISNVDVHYSGITSDDTTPIVGTESTDNCHDGNSFANSSDTFSTSIRTTKDIVRTVSSVGNMKTNNTEQHGNILPYESPITVKTPSYDILEIVASESLNTTYASGSNVSLSEKAQKQNVTSENIDEYVSHILVESLNSLTSQLESMNSSIGANGKLNIIEKEIKIKLQNTGVNTIVHLSPTSNNQIIFGHKELCSSDVRRDNGVGLLPGALSPAIRDEPTSADTNPTSGESLPGGAGLHYPHNSFTNLGQSDNFNKAVLQQIQKLFQDDLQLIEPDTRYSNESMQSISHIEISKADIYLDNERATYSTPIEAIEKPISTETSEVISGVGAGNYYENIADNAIVPRFTAFPHTESMEVNTSSSEDPDVLGSECTSLVDSLDDPNSPRSLVLRKSASRRSELVRSSIDVLDLLPENAYHTASAASKDKGEAFFVTIKDDNCECDREKKDIVVADHMPETIKQRLYRRHRKRELRMECARRSKVKQFRRELDKQRHSELRKPKKEIERQCVSLIKSLIDDVIIKIVQDEFNCMRIKQKSVLMVSSKSDESLYANNWKKDVELVSNGNKIFKNNTSQPCSNKQYRKEKFQIRGKLSLQAYPTLTSNDNKSQRIYQKSEIHDGKKCIEILEILEYISSSASSPDTCNSDDSQSGKFKKSRIPVPVSERTCSLKTSKSLTTSSQTGRADARPDSATIQALRHPAVSHCEPRSRSNSLRFKRMFDMIPEEKSNVVEMGSEDNMYSRRASAPTLADGPPQTEEQIGLRKSHNSIKTAGGDERVNSNPDLSIRNVKETRSAGTSPMPNSAIHRSVLTQTTALVSSSPSRSAATSPIRNMTMSTQTHSPRQKSITNQCPKPKVQQQVLPQSLQYRKEKPRKSQPPLPQGGGNGRRDKMGCWEEDLRLPRCGAERRAGFAGGGSSGAADGSSSSSSGESGGLLCSLAPGWLHARRRRRRFASDAGQWAVTVAGSCRAALPADVEMRLRFPEDHACPRHTSTRLASPPLASPPQSLRRAVKSNARRRPQPGRLTLMLKKEATDSSILASKSVKKSTDPLPDVETFRASRTKTKDSVKTPLGSPHCWLPDVVEPPRASEGLSVRGAAIMPERKPRHPRAPAAHAVPPRAGATTCTCFIKPNHKITTKQ